MMDSMPIKLSLVIRQEQSNNNRVGEQEKKEGR
jgi:hypothetical protein